MSVFVNKATLSVRNSCINNYTVKENDIIYFYIANKVLNIDEAHNGIQYRGKKDMANNLLHGVCIGRK